MVCRILINKYLSVDIRTCSHVHSFSLPLSNPLNKPFITRTLSWDACTYWSNIPISWRTWKRFRVIFPFRFLVASLTSCWSAWALMRHHCKIYAVLMVLCFSHGPVADLSCIDGCHHFDISEMVVDISLDLMTHQCLSYTWTHCWILHRVIAVARFHCSVKPFCMKMHHRCYTIEQNELG